MTSTEAQPVPARRRRLQPFASFGYRNYRWLWAANVCAGAVATTQGFLIAWLSHSPTAVMGECWASSWRYRREWGY
ncbi:MAG: hypothetical protein OXS47_06765 [Chloroflexota bacterium]|nr:hypothetical protein [Chloroflexota bacterium]